MKEHKQLEPRRADFRSKLGPARRAQLVEAGLPKFAFRLMEMRHDKPSATVFIPKRHD